MMRRTIMLIIILYLLTSCGFNKLISSSENWLVGKWTGTGEQMDDTTWTLELNMSNEENISIVYPDLDCSGKWEITSQSKDMIIVKETILEGTDKCDQGVEIELRKINKSKLMAIFYLKDLSDEPIAVATIIKTE